MAIQANELRIGNLVTVNNEKHHPTLNNVPLRVTGISFTTGPDNEPTHSITLNRLNEDPNSYNETYSQFLKFIEPIALTPEILEKAGFEYFKGRYNHLNIKSLMFKNQVDLWLVKSVRNCGITSIKYLHQLQNLYFALTGQELQIETL